MIGDLLDLTHIESGKLALTLGPLALEPLLHECLQTGGRNRRGHRNGA